MITFNFKELIEKKGLSISEVHDLTNISRSTLTLMSNKESKGIQFDTLNTLCNALEVYPDELIAYVPDNFQYDVKTLFKNKHSDSLILEITFGYGSKKKNVIIQSRLSIQTDFNAIDIDCFVVSEDGILVLDKKFNKDISVNYFFEENYNNLEYILDKDFENFSKEVAIHTFSFLENKLKDYVDFTGFLHWDFTILPFFKQKSLAYSIDLNENKQAYLKFKTVEKNKIYSNTTEFEEF